MNKLRFGSDCYTAEQKAMFKQQQSIDIADKFLKELFNQSISRVIVANIMAKFNNTYKKSTASFEEAWGL